MEFASCIERAISGALLGTGMIQLELVTGFQNPPSPRGMDLLRFPTYSVGDLPQLLSTKSQLQLDFPSNACLFFWGRCVVRGMVLGQL